MRNSTLAVIAVCVGLLWVGEAHAARFETHATDPAVPAGTVYDTTTKLLWEMKTSNAIGGLHDVGHRYTWSASGSAADGTAFTSFLASLNGGDYYDPSLGLVVNSNPTNCFANECDWRLPQIGELKEILDLKTNGCRSTPCIAPVFGPTQSDFYWSATTETGNPTFAWMVDFRGGHMFSADKIVDLYVRAVRSGL